MSSFSRELQMTMQAAIREAVARRHAYVTLEHLLFALCHDEDGIDVLRGIKRARTGAAREAFRHRDSASRSRHRSQPPHPSFRLR